MSKVIFGINLSIDGCCDHTKFSGADVEMHEYFMHLLQGADVIVYGRKTYELMVPYWPDIASNPAGEPKAFIDFARAFDSVPKVVFSRTLERVDDKNSSIAHGDLREEILKLKQQGKNISLSGVDLPSQLMAMGLVDEYYFVVHPVLVGEGRRLLEGISLPENLKLKLVETKVFSSGAIALRYLQQ